MDSACAWRVRYICHLFGLLPQNHYCVARKQESNSLLHARRFSNQAAVSATKHRNLNACLGVRILCICFGILIVGLDIHSHDYCRAFQSSMAAERASRANVNISTRHKMSLSLPRFEPLTIH